MRFARSGLWAACFLLALFAWTETEASQWNVGNVIRMFTSVQGLKKEWERDGGYPCISSAGTKDGTTTVMQTKAYELCVVEAETGSTIDCYHTANGDDIVGPVYALHDPSNLFIYSTSSDSYSFDPTTGKSKPYNLQGKSSSAYMTAYGSQLYVPLKDCSLAPTGVNCVEQAGAVGGVLLGLYNSEVITFVRTSTEITSSKKDSYSFQSKDGSFVDWQFDKDVLGVRTTTGYVILGASGLSELHRISGSFKYSSMTSIKFSDGRERTVALETASALQIYKIGSGAPQIVAKTSIKDPGPILGLIKPEYVVFTGSQRAMMVFTSNYASNVNGGVDVSFKDTSVPFPTAATANPSTCNPLLLSVGSGSSTKTIMHTYSGSSLRVFSVCDTRDGDPDCVKPESVTVNTTDGAIVIAIAIALSFALVPSSIYAYRERQNCLAKQSEVPETEVYYDREKGVSYDPAYEAYVNQFSEAKKRKGKGEAKDEDEEDE